MENNGSINQVHRGLLAMYYDKHESSYKCRVKIMKQYLQCRGDLRRANIHKMNKIEKAKKSHLFASTLQYISVQYNTLQYRTIYLNILQYSTIL